MKTRVTLRVNYDFSTKLQKVKRECNFRDNAQTLDFLITLYEEISRFCQTLTNFANAYKDNNFSKQKNNCQTPADQTQLNSLGIKGANRVDRCQTASAFQNSHETTSSDMCGCRCQTSEMTTDVLSGYILANLEAMFRLLAQQVEGRTGEKIVQAVEGLTLCLFAQKVQTSLHKRCRQECTKGANRRDLEFLTDKGFPASSPSYIYKEDSFKEGKEYITNTSPYGEVLGDEKFVPDNTEGKQHQPGYPSEKEKKNKEKVCPPIYVKENPNINRGLSEPGKLEEEPSRIERVKSIVKEEGYNNSEAIVNKALDCIEYWEKISGEPWDADSDYRLLELLNYLTPKRIMHGMEQMVKEANKKGESVRPFRYYVAPILETLRKAYVWGEDTKRVKYFGVVRLDRGRIASPKWVITRWNQKASENNRLLPAQHSLPLAEAIKSLKLEKRVWENVIEFLPEFLERISFKSISLSQLVMNKTRKGSLWIYWVLDELSRKTGEESSSAPSFVKKVVPEPFLERLREQSKEEGLYEALREYLKANNVKIKPHSQGERAIVYLPAGDVPKVIDAFLLAKWKELKEFLSFAGCYKGGKT